MYFYNLNQLFNSILSKYGTNVCLNLKDISYSYNEINSLSCKFVNLLLFNSLKQGDVVAIINTKEIESYALMIACLKLGLPYVNIDVDNPTLRTEKIFDTCHPMLVFSDSDKSENIVELTNKRNILLVDKAQFQQSKFGVEYDDSISQKLDGDTIAYIMFTSGSTGSPKGVAISHQSLLHFIAWSKQRFEVMPHDNFANLSPMYFDNSVFDFYSALFTGASMTPIKKEQFNQPLDLVNYITNKECTIWFSVPSLMIYLMNMRVITDKVLNKIRLFSFGGEGYPKKELKKIFDIYASLSDIYIVYGPSECTCICSSYKISDVDFVDLSVLPSLGEINPNFSYNIVNDNNEISTEGELCLIGPNVGLGYYNDLERTSLHFRHCTDKPHYGKRLYKTGDLVKEVGGLLYFKGRKDFQIKHMGYRIEIEEIELVISEIENVKQSAVIYHRVNESYGKIIAFISIADTTLDVQYITERLSKKLPSYMIPNTFIFYDELPKNANGKIDKNRLREDFVSK